MKKKYLEPEVEKILLRLDIAVAVNLSGGGSNTNLTIVDTTDEDDWEY